MSKSEGLEVKVWRKLCMIASLLLLHLASANQLLIAADTDDAWEVVTAHQSLHFQLQFQDESSRNIDIDVCPHERLEDAIHSSVFFHNPQLLLHFPQLSDIAAFFDLSLANACRHFPDRCDGRPPNRVISQSLFDGDAFIIREGYDESQLLQCYCSKYPCLNDIMKPSTITTVATSASTIHQQHILDGTNLDADKITLKDEVLREDSGVSIAQALAPLATGGDYSDDFFEIYSGQVPEGMTEKYFTHDIPSSTVTVKEDDRIFVSIASYRDPQLRTTVSSLISMCSNPQRLTVVICEQVLSPDDDSFALRDNEDFSSPPLELELEGGAGLGLEVTVLRMPSAQARGPTWARHLIQQQWRGEQFYLQVDSHTRFVRHWDVKLEADLRRAAQTHHPHGDRDTAEEEEEEEDAATPRRVCLTNYPPSFDVHTGEVDATPLRGPMYVTHLDARDRFVRFTSDYIIHHDEEGSGGGDELPFPLLSKGWSGCFSFSSSQIILDAPYDPFLPFLFFGEEMDMFARLFTRGWTMFVPSVPICFSSFDRSYRQTFWGQNPDNALVRFSRMRLHHKFSLLSVQEELQQGKDVYYLGLKKNMTEFFDYIGLSQDVYYNYTRVGR
jgi:hypothetical protein